VVENREDIGGLPGQGPAPEAASAG
jgi:hypothetical protein